jgi:hypothetical protein
LRHLSLSLVQEGPRADRANYPSEEFGYAESDYTHFVTQAVAADAFVTPACRNPLTHPHVSQSVASAGAVLIGDGAVKVGSLQRPVAAAYPCPRANDNLLRSQIFLDLLKRVCHEFSFCLSKAIILPISPPLCLKTALLSDNYHRHNDRKDLQYG